MISGEAFGGGWQLTRDINDRRAGQRGSFVGTAEFTPTSVGFDYNEKGTLQMGDGPSFGATRRYIWELGDGEMRVSFGDGRAFHSFSLTDQPQADHLCGDDMYRVGYDFSGWPDWTARWDVAGPRKDYTMTSRYTR